MWKLIRAGDDFLNEAIKSLKEKINKQDFIKKIKDYASRKSKGLFLPFLLWIFFEKDLSQIEKILKEQHLLQKKSINENNKEILSGFARQKFLKEVNVEFIKKVYLNKITQ